MSIKNFKNPWVDEWKRGGKFDPDWLGEKNDFRSTTENVLNKLKNRPKWDLVYEGYPKNSSGNDDKDADSIFREILGENYDKDIFSNACATRVSLALLNAGVNVKKDFIIQKGKFKGKGFIASAINLKKWLSLSTVFGNADEIFSGPADIINVRHNIGDRNGIYVIVGGFGGGITGHASLWVGSQQDVIGGHNYIAYGGDIFFWELS